MFKRTFTTTVRRASASTSTPTAAPLRRTKDPLLSSSTAQHFVLPSGSQFIVRSPSSKLPPSHPIPSTSTSPSTTSSNPSPEAFTAAFSSHSPFLTSSTTEHLLPSLRQSSDKKMTLSEEEVASLQALRRENPQFWTRSKLASKFGIDQKVVGTLGWGRDQVGKAAERARKEEVEVERERVERKWGWKKSIAREERRRRRAMW